MPEFTIQTAVEGDVLIFRPNGYLDKVAGEAFEKLANEKLGSFTRILINLAGTPVINSSGLAIIVEIISAIVDEKGGTIAICGLSNLARSSFSAIGILPMIKDCPDEPAALAALKAG